MLQYHMVAYGPNTHARTYTHTHGVNTSYINMYQKCHLSNNKSEQEMVFTPDLTWLL